MTKPRAYQVNDPGTHYTNFILPRFPTEPVVDYMGGDYNDFINASVTQIVGGNEEPLPARIVGPTQEPFIGISPGDQFGVIIAGVNSGNVMAVTFQAGDFITINGASSLTASRLAARINATLATYGVSYQAASNNEGYPQIVSASGSSMVTGASASVSLTEVGFTPGTLQRLGFGLVTSVSASGKNPTRGIVTESADGRGGTFPIRYGNGESLLTQTTKLISFKDTLNKFRAWPNIVGGQTIYGRLTHIAPNTIRMSFHAVGFAAPVAVSNHGDFCSLTAIDTISIQLSGYDPLDATSFTLTPVNVSFNFAVNSVNDVVDAINAAWRIAVGCEYATVVSSLPEPYVMDTSDSFTVQVDGETTVSVNFSGYGRQYTAKSVVDVINANWTSLGKSGAIAYVQTNDGMNYVRITSQTAGSSSQLRFIGGRTGINKIGFPYATVEVADIASVYGASEIKLTPPMIESSDSLTVWTMQIDGSAKTKMGLDAYNTILSTVAEIEAIPAIWPNITVPAEIMIPELMELGDVSVVEMTELQKFVNHDTVQQISPWAGSQNSNRPIVYDRNGNISKNTVSGVIYDQISAKTVVIGHTEFNKEVPRISTPFNFNNSAGVWTLMRQMDGLPSLSSSASPRVQALREYVYNFNSETSWHITWNARWDTGGYEWKQDLAKQSVRMLFAQDGNLEIHVHSNTDPTWTSWEYKPFILRMSNPTDPKLQLHGSTATIETPSSRMTLSDNNIAGNSVGKNHLSASYYGGQYLRIADYDATDFDENYSIMHSLNARSTVTCGDGVITFGDFNGTGALEAAVEWLINKLGSTAQATIYLKAGVYKASNVLNIQSLNLSIIGPAQHDGLTAVILNPTNAGHTIVTNRTGEGSGSLYLKNLIIGFDGSATYTNYSIVSNDGAPIVAENCYIKQIKFNNPTASPTAVQGVFKRCRINNSGYSNMPAVMFDNVIDGHKVVFEDCAFTSNYSNNRMIYIKAPDYMIGYAASFDGLVFLRCKFRLSYATTVSGNLTTNTGLIDLHPGVGTGGANDARQNTGLVVQNVVFEDCDVRTHIPWLGTNILLHLTPTANGTNAGGSPSPFMYIDKLVFNRVNFEHIPPGEDMPSAFTIAYGARSLVMRDCTYVISSSTTSSVHGIPTTDVAYAIHGGISNGGQNGTPSDSWTGADKPWGSISIMADDVTIDGFEARGFLQKSGSPNTWREGDVFILYSRSLLVRNVRCKDYMSHVDSTVGVEPFYRWKFHYFGQSSLIDGIVYTPVGLVDGLICNGKQAKQSGGWAGISHIYLNARGIHLTNSSVTGFRLSSNDPDTSYGVKIETRGNGLWDNPWYSTICKVTNCIFSELRNGIRCDFFENTSGAGGFDISGNEISYCSQYGILLNIDLLMRSGIVSGNRISHCGGPGIGYLYMWSTNCSLNIVDNLLSQNYASDTIGNIGSFYAHRQIHMYPRHVGAGYENLVPAVFLDRNALNYLTPVGGIPGFVGITVTNSSGNTAPLASPSPIPGSDSIFGRLYGAETGLSSLPAEYLYTSGSQMTRNQAYLVTPSDAIIFM